MLTTPSHHLVLNYIWKAFFYNKMFHQLLTTKVKLVGLWFFGFSLLPYTKTAVTLVLFQSLETSPNQHYVSIIIKRYFTITWDNSLSTCGCALTELTDFCSSSLFKCPLIWSSSTNGKSSLLQIFHLLS